MSPLGPLAAEALEEALAIAGVGCWQWHTAGRQLWISANFHQLLGGTPETLPATPEAWLELAHPGERQQLADLFESLGNNTARGQASFTLRLKHANGLWHWFEVRLPGAAQGAPDAPVIVSFNEITRQKEAEAALRGEQEQDAHRRNLECLVLERTAELETAHDTLAKIIDSSPVPAFVINADHVITHWNNACEQIIGVPAGEMLGTREQWKAFYPARRPIMADLVISGEMALIQKLYSNKYRKSPLIDGAYEAEDYFPAFDRWLFFTAAPLRDKHGEIVGAIETLQDISERKLAEIALTDAMQAAEAGANAKAEFLANMSHEIRTPMNAVIGLAHLLLRTELTGKQRDFVSRIHGAGQILLGLINDILDFSKIEAGRLQLEETAFALDGVLDSVTSVLLGRAQEKGLELQYVVEPDVPPYLTGDPLRLAQILINLIGNAIKFTANGSVTVFVRCLPGDAQQVTLEFDVQDTGIGMSPEQVDNLFNAFSQADTSITRKFGGTGLGLTISKRLTQMMRGDVWVSSQPNVGSTFTFNVKLGLGRSDPQAPRLAKRRALVVDDSPLARAILISLLEKQGFAAVPAECGEQALSMLGDARAAPFEFVTIDLNMPGMDGLELAEAIRDQISPPPRLVMVTATDTSSLEGEERLSCFDTVLNKPVTAAQIGKLIEQSDPPLPAPPGQPAPLAGMRVLLVEDMPTNQLIACEILESYGITVDTADNGIRALKKLIDDGNSYDVVLMDIQMPEMDGLEATRRLRASARWPDLPIIAMTAHALDTERQRCLDIGMNDFVTKPIDPDGLRDTLIRWRPRKASSAPAKKMESAPMNSADGLPELPGIDKADGLKRMMNKPALYEKILRDFHARFIDEPRIIRAAIAAGDFATAERRAHSTKGLAGTIGALQLQSAAKELEIVLRQGEMPPESISRQFESELHTVIEGIACGFGIEPATPQ
jgi:signal transduction histidine kinase/DNA-binding response OmpR family regulator/HPt (histidine-containing phosphotransfer) domain-containing protein